MIGKLLAKGLHEITLKPVEFDRPLGPRGTSDQNKPTLWECRVSNLNKTRPDCVSRKADPDEAFNGAVDLFFRQKDSPKRAAPKTDKPSRAELDEIEDLI